MVEQVGTGRRLPFDFRAPPSARYVFVSVTRAGSAVGLQPGDIIDMTGWTLSERFAFAYPSAADPVQLVVQRDQQTVVLDQRSDALTRNGGYSRISDIALRLLLLCSGLLIIKYGHGLAALAAGIYLAAVSMADSPTMTFAGLPPWVQTADLVLAALLCRLTVYFARFTFAIQLLKPLRRSTEFSLWAVFGVLSLALFVLIASNVSGVLIGAKPLPIPVFALPTAYICIQTYSVAVFAAAALRASKHQRFAIRIVFFATFFTAASYVIQEAFIIGGKSAPAWMSWYFNSALLFAGIGYPWAIFARQIAGVDFIISRGVGYAISIGVIVIAVNLLETIAEQVASGWIAGIMLDYGVPVALGLSLNWVQGRVTAMLESILDHDLLNTSRVLRQLKSEMADDGNIAELSARVSRKLAHSLRAECIAVYRENGGSLHLLGQASLRVGPIGKTAEKVSLHDPAIAGMRAASSPIELDGMSSALGKGMLFPLVVLGRVVGALHCGARTYDRGYDRGERAILEDFSRDLAVAILCLDPSSDLRNLPITLGDGQHVPEMIETRPPENPACERQRQ
ncbi:MAG: hypothetical protein JOZ42_08010 [Acetobacteraceae bacterium]|nr:hypothetical protein [Acetobacteraceae bacterium]